MNTLFALNARALTLGLSAVLAVSAAMPGTAAAAVIDANGRSRPKICVVLSGGGARGAAHVGVLKVLEELRVPVDCITGTSMGSLIGGAYATGMSVPEMEAINAEITTELLFKENPPRQEMSMRRKEDDMQNFIGPEFGVKDGGLSFGKGIVTGVQLETVLRRLSKASGYRRFDRLPIPFRAVATDLETGKAVVFSEGELANVMRASMSVPGAVAPAELEGRMLVDGMLTSNLPVDAARAMGADVVIAVNVGTPLLTRDKLNGITGVMGQMLSILTEQNVQASLASLKADDILISPELGNYSTGDFDSLPKIAPLGEEAARKVAEKLSRLAMPPAEYAAWRKRQQVQQEEPVTPVDTIRFEGLSRVNPITARAVMETPVGVPLDQDLLDADMRRLYGTGDFEHLNYRIKDEEGKQVLSIAATEKTVGPDYLRFGLGLSTDFQGDSFFNLLGSYRKTWLNSLGAEWRTDLQLGNTSGFSSEFYQPLNAQGSLFIAPSISADTRLVSIFTGDERVARYDVSQSRIALDLGSQFFRYGNVRLGLERGLAHSSLDTGIPAFKPEQDPVATGGVVLRLALDQLDSTFIPRSGWYLKATVYDSRAELGADHVYTKWDVSGLSAYSFGEHTLSFGLRAGDTLGSGPLPFYDQFQWGGFLQGSGYATGQLIGDSLRFARMRYYHRLMRGSLLEGAYGGFSLETTQINPLVPVPGNTSAPVQSGSIFVAADSPLGPAYLGYGSTTDGRRSFYFYLGKSF